MCKDEFSGCRIKEFFDDGFTGRNYVDDDAAAIVRRISLMVIDNMPRREIVKILNEENVPTPDVYKQCKGCTRDWFPDGKKGGWNTSMIAKIIRDERYAGHMVSYKKEYESFDSKHQIAVDKYIVFY